MKLELKYPPFDIKLKKQNNETFVFDLVRKKWIVLTPEEWVRQHVISFLITEKNYPISFIAVEKEIALNDLKKRFDIVVYSKDLKPKILIECKAPYIELDREVMEQALRYNLNLQADFVMITNGMSDFIMNSFTFINELPKNHTQIS